MKRCQRKTAPGVKDGRTQRKNRVAQTPDLWTYTPSSPAIERQPPGEGNRHYLLKRDVECFIGLLPDWTELSRGLKLILLATGQPDCMGWYQPGIVAICAEERELVQDWDRDFFLEHRETLDKLNVAVEVAEWADDPDRTGRTSDIDSSTVGSIRCHFSPQTMKAFQLLHIFLHELGHHHDRMTTRSKRQPCRGERYAEDYAVKYADQIWDRYCRQFGL